MTINDGLDELSDDQLHRLAITNGVSRFIMWSDEANAFQRHDVIAELRRQGVTSPYSRQKKQPKEQPSMTSGLPTHPTESDITNYEEIQEIVGPDEGGEIQQWRVTMDSGNHVVVYASVAAMVDVENAGYEVVRMTDDDVINVSTSEAYDRELFPEPYPQTPAPRLPQRRIGKHQTGDVIPIERGLVSPGKSPGTPMRRSVPHNAPPPEQPTYFPRHRKRRD